MPETIESPTYRSFVTQRESAPKVLDVTDIPIKRKDMNTDDNGWQPAQRFIEHSPDGFDTVIGTALVGEDGVYGGNHEPRYAEVKLDMPLICGPEGLISSTTLGDGRPKTVYQLPHTPRTIKEIAAWFGYGSKTNLLQQGAIRSWSIETAKSGETGGSKEYHFLSFLRNQALPNQVAQSAILRFDATNVTGNGVFAISNNGAAAQNVTLAVGDTTGQIVTKLAAVGLTATVVGTVATVPGSVHRLVANQATGNATIYDNISVTPTMTAAALQTAIQAKGGAYANATVTKTPFVVQVLGTQGGELDGLYTENGTYNSKPKFTSAANKDLLNDVTYNNWNLGLTPINYGQIGSTTWPWSTGAYLRNGNGANPFTLNISFSVTYEISFPLNAGAQTITSTPGTNWSTQNTAPANATGTIVATVTAPANTPITTNWVSGAGWSTTLNQPGQDGSGPYELYGSNIEPTHWVVYKAATKNELDAIDMGTRTVPASVSDSHIVKTATGHGITIEGLVGQTQVEDRSLSGYRHVPLAPTVTGTLTLLVQQDANGEDYCESIYTSENRGGCSTTPFWLRFAARCGERELWIDLHCARNAQIDPTTEEGVAMWQFPLTRIYRKAGSLFFTIIEPAP